MYLVSSRYAYYVERLYREVEMISREHIEALKTSVDLGGLIRSRGIALRKNGKGYKGQHIRVEKNPSSLIEQAGGRAHRHSQSQQANRLPDPCRDLRSAAGKAGRLSAGAPRQRTPARENFRGGSQS